MQVVQEEEKPILLSCSKSESIVDLFESSWKYKRGKIYCNYCRNPIQDHWAFRKTRSDKVRYYHLKCSKRAGFDIRNIPDQEQALPSSISMKEETLPCLIESKDEINYKVHCLLVRAILESDRFTRLGCDVHGWISETTWQQHVKAPSQIGNKIK
jgi:hypothetical protein